MDGNWNSKYPSVKIFLQCFSFVIDPSTSTGSVETRESLLYFRNDAYKAIFDSDWFNIQQLSSVMFQTYRLNSYKFGKVPKKMPPLELDNPGIDTCSTLKNAHRCEQEDHCIDAHQCCDGIWDCANGDDELNCTDCAKNAFNCGDGQCVNQRFRCDGHHQSVIIMLIAPFYSVE